VQRRRDKVFTPCAEQRGEGGDEVQVASVEGECGGGSMCARLEQGRETLVAGRNGCRKPCFWYWSNNIRF
jgi:hypothetical protein